ncbi:MAG: Flp pilus assembly protein CpaB [Bradymonadia bacterium]
MSARKGGRASKAGALGFTLLALILTILTMILGSRFLSSTQYANEPVIEVVVAAKNLPASVAIMEDHITVVKWPKSTVPEGAFTKVADFLGPEPRVPVSTIFAGEPVLPARLASSKSGTGMASLVPQTMRGFPVPVDSWIADARLVYPGAYVDVLATLRDALTRKPTTKLVLQNVRVLAVDGFLDPALRDEEKKRDGNKAVVTLLVTPEQAETLALSSREGKVDLMLRNANDDSMVDTLGIDPNELLGVPDEEEEQVATAPPAASDPPPRRRRRRRRGSRVRNVPTSPGEAEAIRRGAQPPRGGGNSRVKTVELGAP